jgi:hypothetical protein
MPESLTFQERFQDYALEPVPDEKRRGLFSSITVFCGWVVTTTQVKNGSCPGGYWTA